MGHFSFIVLVSMSACLAAAQQSIQNAKLETRPVTGNLETQVRSLISQSDTPVWIGYAVDAIPGERQMCCSNNNCLGCAVEGGSFTGTSGASKAYLEGPAQMYVFFRTISGRVDKIRTFTPDCPIDGGGVPFYWINGVNSGQSLAVLKNLSAASPTSSKSEQKLASNAVAAIAQHKDSQADQLLEDLLRPGRPESVRRNAMFWISHARGQHGLAVVERILAK